MSNISLTFFRPDLEYVAVPVFQLLEANNLNKLVPATACLLVLSCSGAFLELFPELCNIIVRLATAEWKILSRQISYESPDSGSPMLAIFIAGKWRKEGYVSNDLKFSCLKLEF